MHAIADHTAIQLLVLEDQPDDAELMVAELRRSGFEVHWHRVQTEAEFFERLNPAVDVILADYHLPHFDALGALALLRQRDLEIPFIIVSGSIDDESAVAAMKHGASDYLLKDRMARLGPAVAQALQAKRLRDACKQTDEALRKSLRRYGTLAGVSPVGIMHLDPAGQCLYVNNRWRKISGLAAEQARGELWTQTLHPEDRGRVTADWRTALQLKQPFNMEHRFQRPDGSVACVFHQVVADTAPDGALNGYVAIITDITELKRATEALRASEERYRKICDELATKNRRLADLYDTAHRFVDNVSHEFRTPLTVIKGCADVITEGLAGPVDKQQADLLQVMKDRTRELAQMVDDMLDTSKLRAGTLRVDRRASSVADIFARVRPVIAAVALANKVVLTEQLAAGLPDVFADSEKVSRTIVNLTVNAIKFSPEGAQVLLWAKAADGGVQIGVTDHGAGIDPDQLAIIFDRFRQGSQPPRSSTKGFGLGLNIAKELVTLNLGTMVATSSVGGGSTFSFTLPPVDPAQVLDRYLAWLDADGSASGSICVLGFSKDAAAPAQWDMHAFIASIAKPMELIFDSRGGELLVVTCCDDLAGWSRRLLDSAAESTSRDNVAPPASPARVRELGRWPYPAAKHEATFQVLCELKAEVAHAA